MNVQKIIAILLLSICFSSLLAAPHARRIARGPRGYDDGISGKGEFKMSLGSQVGDPFDKALLIDVGGGYNINSNLYIGASTGIYPYFGVVFILDPDPVVPLLADVVYRINPASERWSYFFQTRLGGLLHTQSSDVVMYTPEGGQEYVEEPYTRKNYVDFELGGGIYYRILRNVDLTLSLNYAVAAPGDDGFEPARNCTEHLLQARIGMNFRGKPKSPSRSEMLADEAREHAAQQKEYERYWAQKQAQEEEELRQEEEARAERRRQREEAAKNAAPDPLLAVTKSTYEFYAYVTADMIDNGSLDNKLISLASMAAGKTVSSIVVLGVTAGESSSDASSVIEANNNSDKVRTYLNKRYVIDKNLITTVFSGFDEIAKPANRPKGTIGVIMIEKVSEK